MSNKTNPLENLEEELVDYVSNTPNNTNPSVVKSMVRAAADGVSTGGSAPFIVTLTDHYNGNFSIDKTFDEVEAAYLEGRPVYLYQPYNGNLHLMMTNLHYGSAIFYAPYGEGVTIYTINSSGVTMKNWPHKS